MPLQILAYKNLCLVERDSLMIEVSIGPILISVGVIAAITAIVVIIIVLLVKIYNNTKTNK